MIAWHLGNCVDGLRATEGASVDLTVTSCPYAYGGLRHFGGHRFDFGVFKAVASELWRVTKPGGIVCWQEGDQMVALPGGGSTLTDTPYRHLLYFRGLGFAHYETLYTGQDGWRVRHRHYATPPDTLWVLVKGRPTTVNLLTRKNATAGQRTGGVGWRKPDGTRVQRPRVTVYPRSARTVYWTYSGRFTTEPDFSDAHPATMHCHLARDLVLSYSDPRDLVCDPFGGVATTGQAAVLLGRQFVGWEIHAPYHAWGRRRLDDTLDHVRREAIDALRNRSMTTR